jgi:hypothetical protein
MTKQNDKKLLLKYFCNFFNIKYLVVLRILLYYSFYKHRWDVYKKTAQYPHGRWTENKSLVMNKNASALFYSLFGAKFIVPCQQGFKPIHANL